MAEQLTTECGSMWNKVLFEVGHCCVSQPKIRKSSAPAATKTASSNPPIVSLLDAPLDQMMADPWASLARPTAATVWSGPIDTVTANQSDAWTSRRSPSPGLQIFAQISLLSVAMDFFSDFFIGLNGVK